jgi:hypothetical protein
MVNGNDYLPAGTSSLIPADAALYRAGASGSTTQVDGPPPPESSEDEVLARLADRIEEIGLRLTALLDALAPIIQGTDGGQASPPPVAAAPEVKVAEDALTYAAFFQEAVKLGMSPTMVSDAYRLADLADVTANLETGEVTGAEQVAVALLETKPYLFAAGPPDVGTETNPAKGPSLYPEQVESLARALGVSPGFASELVKKRSDRVRGGLALSEIWRIPRGNRLSYLESGT